MIMVVVSTMVMMRVVMTMMVIIMSDGGADGDADSYVHDCSADLGRRDDVLHLK